MRKMIAQYPGVLWLLAIGMAINVIGNSFLWPMNTIYIHFELDKPVRVAGLVLMLQAGCALIGNLAGGALFDRFGGKYTIMIGVVMSLITVILMAFFQSFTVYVGLMMLLGLSNGAVFPAMYAAAKTAWPEGGRKTFNLIYIAQNVGVAVGTALGGLIAGIDFTYVFLGNAITYIVFLGIIYSFIKIDPHALNGDHKQVNDDKEEVHTVASPKKKFRLTMGMVPLLLLCFGYTLCWLAYVQWQTSISAHLTNLGYSRSSYSLLWTVNGFLIVVAQPIVIWLANKMPSIRLQLTVGSIIFAFAMVSIIGADSYTGFMVGMIIMTLGEMFIWPGVPAAAAELAPEGRTGMYQGIVGSAATMGRMIGPLIGGFLFDFYSTDVMVYWMIGFVAFSAVVFASYNTFGQFITSTIARRKQKILQKTR